MLGEATHPGPRCPRCPCRAEQDCGALTILQRGRAMALGCVCRSNREEGCVSLKQTCSLLTCSEGGSQPGAARLRHEPAPGGFWAWGNEAHADAGALTWPEKQGPSCPTRESLSPAATTRHQADVSASNWGQIPDPTEDSYGQARSPPNTAYSGVNDEFAGLGQVLGQQRPPHVTAQGVLRGEVGEDVSLV